MAFVKAAEQIDYHLITFLVDLPPAFPRKDSEIVGVAPTFALVTLQRHHIDSTYTAIIGFGNSSPSMLRKVLDNFAHISPSFLMHFNKIVKRIPEEKKSKSECKEEEIQPQTNDKNGEEEVENNEESNEKVTRVPSISKRDSGLSNNNLNA
ncbi:hypothetical protein GQX74_010762 [Glossina fuscipes]|nr:hypothetical protein GQX74_010762 [Glossina fuscipes]